MLNLAYSTGTFNPGEFDWDYYASQFKQQDMNTPNTNEGLTDNNLDQPVDIEIHGPAYADSFIKSDVYDGPDQDCEHPESLPESQQTAEDGDYKIGYDSGEYGRVVTGPSDRRSISIHQLHSGYNVEVGCHTFAFETPERLTKYILEYLKDPIETERKWFNGELDLSK